MKTGSFTRNLPAPRSVHDVQMEDGLSSSYDAMEIEQVLWFFQFIRLEFASIFLYRLSRNFREVAEVTTDVHPNLSSKPSYIRR